MPTDLPPDYKPQPARDPNNPAAPNVPGSTQTYPPQQGEDAREAPPAVPEPGVDAVDPPVWPVPPIVPDDEPGERPLPAGMPVF